MRSSPRDDQSPQSLTLSLRISEALRKRLEDLRQLARQKTGGNVSMSEVAKQLLDTARENRLEVVDLLSKATESLLTMRRKAESGQPLSRAEWTVLAHYVQKGVETYSKSEISRESYIAIVEAFQAVYELRGGKPSGQDEFYVGNLPTKCQPEGHGVSDPATPEIVRQTVAETLRCVKSPIIRCLPVHAARNLYAFLEDDKIPGLTRLNEALFPYWKVLWRVAARGHYLSIGQPVRDKSQERDSSYRPLIPSTEKSGYSLTIIRKRGGEVDLLLNFPEGRSGLYPMGSYPMIAEFRAMLEALPKAQALKAWDGVYFFGYRGERESPTQFWFRSQDSGITFGFTSEEWSALMEIFAKAWEHPELRYAWEALGQEYGEL